MKSRFLYGLFLLLGLHTSVSAQQKVNYEESKIGPYQLPELLTLENGERVRTAAEWEQLRRPEILGLFEGEVYGAVPPTARSAVPTIQMVEESFAALGNIAIRKQVVLTFSGNGKKLPVHLLIYLPKNISNPPIFVGYNFYGNHTTIDDPHVVLTNSWIPNNPVFGITENRATEESRGRRSNRWPIRHMINRGFGVVTLYYGDVDPDRNDFSDGVHALHYEQDQHAPEENEWGSVAAWAWGLSRVMDYLKQEETLRHSKYIVLGHSRLGKAALWAGAQDTRFDMVISNESGCGGAALSRRKFGETVALINQSFPHWFAPAFKKYNDNEHTLPVDQHMLLGLIAPRPLYVASAEEDQWADPKGEYLSAYYAGAAYTLYKKPVLTSQYPPRVNQPIHRTIGYHIRTGKHDITDYDWDQFMKFARLHL